MFLIVRDIEWFQEHRRDFLSKKQPGNYSIYMSGLPVEYQSDAALKKHFTQQKSNVVEARVALVIPNLEQDVSNRDAIVENFEHAINVRIVKGTEPMHKTKMCGGEKVNSIPTYDKELEELNDTISKEIDNIESLQRTRNGQDDGDDIENPISKHEPKVVEDILVKNEEDEETDPASVHMAEMKIETSQNNGCKIDSNISTEPIAIPEKNSSVVAGFAASIKSLMSSEDGAPRSAAFVSFADLTSTNLALQAVHHHKPWVCDVQPAPAPDQVEWKNVGASNKSKQIGELMSLILTAVCFCHIFAF
jgi:hypothetical protein